MSDSKLDQLWGEYTLVGEISNQVTRSMIEMKTPKPYTITQDGPSQFGSFQHESKPIEKCPYVQHMIHLQHYIKESNRLIKSGKSSNVKNLEFSKSLKRFGLKKAAGDKILPSKSSNPLTKKSQVIECNSYDEANIDNLIQMSVLQLSLSVGFENSQSTALDILKDATKSYIKQMCTKLRMIVDNEALTGITGFYDPIDQLLHDNNIDGIQELANFYKKDVIKKHSNLVKTALNIDSKFGSQLISDIPSSSSSSTPAPSWNLADLCENDVWKPCGKVRQQQSYINTFQPVNEEPERKRPRISDIKSEF